MANTILTSHMAVNAPTTIVQTIEEPVMADAEVFPRFMFPAGGPTGPDYGGRCFTSKEELAAAEGEWFLTPQEAQAAAATKAPAAPAPAPEDDEPQARRSHR
jgi:hypothetical protein